MRRVARFLPLLALALVIAVGGYLRLARLGAAEFEQDDDLDLYFAARSIQAGRGPLLPSGMPYARGQDVAKLVAFTNGHVADPETAARLPSALFGLLDLVLFAAIAWAIAGPWASVLAVALMAMNPELVFQSRSARFYTYQAFYGLVALFAGWRVLRRMGVHEEPDVDDVRRQWGWAALTLIAFGLAIHVQVTTLSVLAGWGAAVAVAAALDVRARGWRSWRRSVPLQLTAVGAVILVLAAIAAVAIPGVARNTASLIRYVPTWAGGTPGSPLAYYYGLSEQYPAVLALIPAIFLVLLVRRPRLATFLLLWFAVPLVLHSFVLAWKADRYILLAMPALFLAAGAVGADGLATLRSALERALTRSHVSQRTSASLAATAVTMTALFVLVTTPALGRARKSMDSKIPGYLAGWRATGSVLASVPGSDTVPIGSTIPLAALRYWGHVNFAVQRGLADNAIRGGKPVDGNANGDDITRGASKATAQRDTVLRDFYVGVPILLTPEAIRARFRNQAAVLVAVDSFSVAFDNVDTSLVRALHQNGEELCHGRCGGMRLYRFPISPPASSSRPDSH